MTGTLVRSRFRELRSSDRPRIQQIVTDAGNFRPAEIQIAMEVFDASCLPGQTDYFALGAEIDGRLAGWICWGPTPGTIGTFDLYWLAVHPDAQRRKIGSALVTEMERRLTTGQMGRLIVIETSSRTDYHSTRRFYQTRGYQVTGVIPDFYEPGDDQVILTKAIGQ